MRKGRQRCWGFFLYSWQKGHTNWERSIGLFVPFPQLSLLHRGFRLFLIVDVVSHLPDLHDVVLADGADDPRLVRIPGEVGDLKSFSIDMK